MKGGGGEGGDSPPRDASGDTEPPGKSLSLARGALKPERNNVDTFFAIITAPVRDIPVDSVVHLAIMCDGIGKLSALLDTIHWCRNIQPVALSNIKDHTIVLTSPRQSKVITKIPSSIKVTVDTLSVIIGQKTEPEHSDNNAIRSGLNIPAGERHYIIRSLLANHNLLTLPRNITGAVEPHTFVTFDHIPRSFDDDQLKKGVTVRDKSHTALLSAAQFVVEIDGVAGFIETESGARSGRRAHAVTDRLKVENDGGHIAHLTILLCLRIGGREDITGIESVFLAELRNVGREAHGSDRGDGFCVDWISVAHREEGVWGGSRPTSEE